MPDRRGSAGLTLLLVLAAFAAGAGMHAWLARPRTIPPPPEVAADSAQLVADSIQHAHEVADASQRNDSLAAETDSLDRWSQVNERYARRVQHAADSIAAARSAIAQPSASASDSVRFWQETSYNFNAENIQLRLTINADSVALANVRLALRSSQQRANLLQGSWANSENQILRQRELMRDMVDHLQDALKGARLPSPWSVGVGADAIAVLSGDPCFSSVAGPQVSVRTRGWVKLEGRATAGYGAAGCVSEAPTVGPAVQIGGSIGL
jgi:hypothetical protein